MSRIYKAKYFPKSSFLEAQLGGNPSFIWQSVLETQEVIREGYRWTVSDETSIHIWGDPWLLNVSSSFIRSPLTDNVGVTKVCDLFNASKTGWDNTVHNDIFVPTDMELIRNILVAEDKIIWSMKDKGCYTVKSCYRKLTEDLHSRQIPFWTRVWKLLLPPKIKVFFWHVCSGSLPTNELLSIRKVQVPHVCHLCGLEEESIFHIFTRCPLARSCWDYLGSIAYQNFSSFWDWLEYHFLSLSVKDLCLMITTCRKIWEARNEKLWNNVVLSTFDVVTGAQSFLLEWQMANQSARQLGHNGSQDAKWESPPEGWLKLNVDAALDSSNRKMGMGFVLRDFEGTFVAAKQVPWIGLFKPVEAEAISVRGFKVDQGAQSVIYTG